MGLGVRRWCCWSWGGGAMVLLLFLFLLDCGQVRGWVVYGPYREESEGCFRSAPPRRGWLVIRYGEGEPGGSIWLAGWLGGLRLRLWLWCRVWLGFVGVKFCQEGGVPEKGESPIYLLQSFPRQ